MLTKTAGEPPSAGTQQKFHFMYMVPYTVWKLLVRPFIVHKFHFIHGVMYGNDICVVPYFASSISYMAPCMEVTCASFRISQVPLHTWCHIWKLHLRPSVFHKFQFIHGAIYGSYMRSFRVSQVPHHIWYHRWHHVWYHIKVLQPYMAPNIPYMVPYNPYMHAIYDFFYKGVNSFGICQAFSGL